MSDSEKNQQIRQAFEKARAARMAGKRQDAVDAWAEVLEMTATPANLEQRQARMAAASESAMVFQEVGDMRKAHELLREAVAQAEAVVEQNPTPEAWLAVAGVRVNLAALLVAGRIAKEGEETAAAALEATAKAANKEGSVLLTFAAKMQLGSAQLLQGNAEAGAATIASSVEAGIQLVEQGQQAALPQLIEAVARMGAGARIAGTLQNHVGLSERVARLAEAAFQAGGPQFVNLFIGSQMAHATWLTELGRFAQAEDVLWKAIDGSGQGALLVSAPNFYAQAWRADDDVLEKGDLPREEVKEAWHEAIEKAEKRGADAVAVQAMRARYAMHVEKNVAPAQEILAANNSQNSELSGLAKEVLMVLQQELNAAQPS